MKLAAFGEKGSAESRLHDGKPIGREALRAAGRRRYEGAGNGPGKNERNNATIFRKFLFEP